MIKNYGVDPYADARSATTAAGLLLREIHGRTGDWDKAVAGYHGGIAAERGHRGPQNRAYTSRVGSFENDGEQPMAGGLIEIADSYNPHYGEKSEPVPIPGDPGISRSVSPTSEVATKKRRGLLGSIGHALGSVFMPEADSLYAAALRGGIWDAKANQAKYKADVDRTAIDTEMANAKLKNFLTKGEYQIAGNNVVHYPPGGGAPEIIAAPATPTEKERLIDRWRSIDDSDPAKQLIDDMLRGYNSEAAQEGRENVARIRAGATTTSARIRANAPSKAGPKYEYRMVGDKLQRRRIN